MFLTSRFLWTHKQVSDPIVREEVFFNSLLNCYYVNPVKFDTSVQLVSGSYQGICKKLRQGSFKIILHSFSAPEDKCFN